MMAQLENVGGQGGPFVTQGDVSVSYSRDGGIAWSEPVTVMKGKGASIGPANRATFFDKEWLTVDNNPASPFYGRAYVVSARFLNALQGAYAESAVYFAYSDDGGRTWSTPKEISGSNPLCTEQSTGPAGECDENGFPIPEVAPNGDLIVHFQNSNITTAWETPGEFESTLLAVKSTNGGSDVHRTGRHRQPGGRRRRHPMERYRTPDRHRAPDPLAVTGHHHRGPDEPRALGGGLQRQLRRHPRRGPRELPG